MKKIKIALLTLCLMMINVAHVQAIVTIEGNTGSFGGNHPCGASSAGTYIACYEPKFEFRVTLVDWDGKKVAGTKSVEYGYSTDKKTKIVTYTAAQKSTFVNGDKFGYKYSSEYNDYNPISDHVYYQINMMDNPIRFRKAGTQKDDPANYSQFSKIFLDSIKTKEKRYGIENGTTGEYDFISMFLYHSGFLNKNQTDGKYYNIDDTTNQTVKDAAAKLANPDPNASENDHHEYYLLIEPLYTIFHNDEKWGSVFYKYGTATEMGNYLYSKANNQDNKMRAGYLKGLTLIFTYNAGTNMFTQPSSIEYFRQSKPLQHIDENDIARYNTNNPTGDLLDRPYRKNKWAEIGNTNYGYGESVLRVSNFIPKPISETLTNIYQMDRCSNSRKEKNNSDGIVEFSSEEVTKQREFFKNEQNKFEKNESNGNVIYCYDDFKYDFSSILTSLNRPIDNPFEPNTKVTIPKGELTITRYCYIKNTNSISNQTKGFAQDFSMYYQNKKIDVKIFNETLKLEPDTTSMEIKERWVQIPSENKITKKYYGDGIISYTTTIDFVYKKNNSIYIIPTGLQTNKEYTAHVDLSNVSYGYSTNLIEQLKNSNIEYKIVGNNNIEYNYKLNLQYRYGDSNVCEFVTSVKDGKFEDKIKYRTIALDNPFPGRDASSRMPGSNWLGKNNYIRGYITYNRGVTGDAVYDKDPLYTIELTPSTMIKIREYNRAHNYGDIKLNCSGENNTECMSEFLRKTSIFKSGSVTGTCMITSNTYKDIKNGVTLDQFNQKLANMTEDFVQESSYDSKYDFNHDKRVNRNDALIFEYAEKTTPYYTCADKTFENSGYLERSGN